MGRDLQVLSIETGEKKETQSNFLTAMTVPSSSFLAKKSASQAGLTRLAGIVLVSIERPLLNAELKVVKASPRRRFVKTDSSAALKVESVSFDEDLAVGDILWFAGTASSIGDTLRQVKLFCFRSKPFDILSSAKFFLSSLVGEYQGWSHTRVMKFINSRKEFKIEGWFKLSFPNSLA